MNGNGSDELILLDKSGYILAIFNESEHAIRLIEAFHGRYSCYISKDGYISTSASGINKKYRISNDDKGLVFVDGVGFWTTSTVPYSRFVNEYEEVTITETEYNALAQEIWPREYRDITDCSAYGLNFTPLFKE